MHRRSTTEFGSSNVKLELAQTATPTDLVFRGICLMHGFQFGRRKRSHQSKTVLPHFVLLTRSFDVLLNLIDFVYVVYNEARPEWSFRDFTLCGSVLIYFASHSWFAFHVIFYREEFTPLLQRQGRKFQDFFVLFFCAFVYVALSFRYIPDAFNEPPILAVIEVLRVVIDVIYVSSDH